MIKLALDQLKSMLVPILLNTGIVEFLKTLPTVLIVKMKIFQIKILNEINFCLVIIYVLINFKAILQLN